jgi:ParB family transcriptional regulator, chromosome partitioning protein
MKSNLKNEKSLSEESIYQLVDPAEVSPWCRNPRKRFDAEAAKELEESVRRLGVRTPITVRPVTDWAGDDLLETDYVVICGERRWRAAKAAGVKLPVMVDSQISEREAFEVALFENLDRADLDIFEEAGAYAELIGFGYSVSELAAKYNKSRDWLGQQLALLALNEEERKELISGTIAVRTAVEILKVPDAAERKRALDEVVHPKYQEGPLSRDKAVALVRDRFVRPAVEAEAWASRQGELAKEFLGAEILTYEESKEVGRFNSPLVSVDSKPALHFDFLCSASMNEDDDERPTWGELVKKYGGVLQIAAPVEPKSPPRVLVAWKPLYEADLERGLGDEAVFRKPVNSEEGKAERLERDRERENLAALSRRLTAEKREIVSQLRGGTLASVMSDFVEVWLDDYGHEEEADLAHELVSPDEALDAAGLKDWVREIVRKRGVEGLMWIGVAAHLATVCKPGCVAYASAVGNRQEFPVILGGEEAE